MLSRRDFLLYAVGAGLLPLGCASSPHIRTKDYKDNLPFLGLSQSLKEEFDYDAVIEGNIPDSLRGVLYRNSSGLFERAGLRKRTMFEGDGLVRGYWFNEKGVRFKCKFVRTEKFIEEESKGRFIYPTFSTQAPGGLLNNFWAGDKIKSQAQISVVFIDGRLFAFDESSLPYELDPESLDTIGKTDLGVLGAIYSAHPKIDMRAGQWVHFGLHYAKDVQIHITIFDRKGHSHFLLKLPRYVHIHDFFLTESYLIFNLHPMEIGLFDFLSGRKSLAESFRWRPEKGNLLMILNKDGGSPPIYIEISPVFMWHGINSFQDKDTIIADFIGYKSPDHFLGSNSPIYAVMRGERGFYKDRGEIKRYIIEPKKKQASEFLLYEGSGYEWPSIDPMDRCYDYRFAYAAKAKEGDFFWSGLTEVNTENSKGSNFFFDDGSYCSEPIFAGSKDEGFLLSEVYDSKIKKNYLSIFRAHGLSDGPIAKIHLRHHLPFSMHGFWRGQGKAEGFVFLSHRV